MFVNVEFSEFNKKNDEQMFVNVKKSSTFNSLFKINNEKLLKKIHDNDNNVFMTVSASDQLKQIKVDV